MLSPRLLSIASFVQKHETVLDIGTDHAYLPIYLVKNKLCKNVLASDVSCGAIENAKNNIKKYNADIKTYLTDGLQNIDEYYDCITISGMGTSTIKNILDGNKLPDHIILSSNNNLDELRLFMNNLGYKIDKEIVLEDHHKYYDVISYIKGTEKLLDYEITYGKSTNKEYFIKLLSKEKNILKKITFFKRFTKRKDIKLLKKKIKSIC